MRMDYCLPTQIIFRPGSSDEIGQIVQDKLRSSRPFLVTDKGIQAAGILERVKGPLAGIPIFDEVEPNPRHTTIDRAGELVRTIQPDLVIGLGGGSVLDAAKAIALLATNPGSIEEYEGREKYKFPPLRVLAIPTTCGTGSEVTWVSVITHVGRRFKMSIKGTQMFPVAALLDPDLLVTLPSHLVASTGLDALTHALEAYTSKASTFLTDLFAREALRLVFRYLPHAYANIKDDGEAREMMMLGSLLAGLAFGNSDVGAVHCLAEALGSLYDTPHGLANAVFLPWVMEFNFEVSRPRYAEIGQLIGIETESEDERAKQLIEKIKGLSQVLRIPSFRSLGVEEKDLPLIARKSFENNSNLSNPRPATEEDYLVILRKALLV
ncbi:MAG: iron-containing alcohol dehydrogenase [Candidatus Aminicenantales bacterium]